MHKNNLPINPFLWPSCRISCFRIKGVQLSQVEFIISMYIPVVLDFQNWVRYK